MSLRVYRQLSAVPESFQSLIDEDEGGHFLISRSWYENFEELGLYPGTAQLIYTVGEESDPLGLAVAIGMWIHLGFFNTKLVTFVHPDGVEFRARLRRGEDSPDVVIDEIAAALGRGERSCDIAKLGPFERHDERLKMAQRSLRRHGFITQTYRLETNCFEDFGRISADDYLAARPSKLRNTIRRRMKRLEQEANGQLQVIRGGEHLESGIADYIRILVSSWQGRHPMSFEYLSALLNIAASRDVLRLGIYYVDGRPAAGQIWLVSSDTAMIYRLAYDQRFTRYSIGTLLTHEMFRHVITEDRVTKVDFGTGTEPFKQDWVGSSRELWGVSGYNRRSLAGLNAASMAFTKSALKVVLRRMGFRTKQETSDPL